MPLPLQHGTRNSYQKYHCRCQPCRDAEKKYNIERKSKNPHVIELERARQKRYAALHPDRRAKSADKWRKAHPEQHREGAKRRWIRWRLKAYGITEEQRIALIKKQKGKCAICGSPDNRNLSIDHDHKTKKVRGLLCRKCNLGLGCFGDDVHTMDKAIKYLRE